MSYYELGMNYVEFLLLLALGVNMKVLDNFVGFSVALV